MNLVRFRAHVQGAGLDVKKLRDLEVLRLSYQGRSLMDIRYSDVFDITNFREWFERKIAPKVR